MEQRTPVADETINNAVPRVSKYFYDFGGRLVKEEYPSGRIVENEFESDGDLSRVFGKSTASAHERTYVNSFSYTASGGISQMRLGNGRWETAKFNDRLQVTELGLGNSAADASVWKINYGYGELDANGNIVSGTNTGNIGKVTLSFAGLANPIIQTFKYDSLYRLKEAKETSNSAQNWVQNFSYDRYGNRTALAQNISGIVNNSTPAIDPNSNRFEPGQGFSFDKNGNIVSDVSNINQSRSFVFNAENKQVEVRDANGNPIGKYFYDGENRRVKKITDTETTVFVYSAGKLVAEYSTKTPPQNPTISYTTTDHLVSPRVITDAVEQVVSRRDFLPFGEELTVNVGARSSSLKYGADDDIRQKFTGYQKDEETKLDFAEARMYENRHARFTAVDPLLASGKSSNPQSFNRYVYVQNSPIIATDPTGLCGGPNDPCPDFYIGPVYTKMIDGERRYNNVQPDKSWAIFTESDEFVRSDTQYRTIVNKNGWYAAPTEGQERAMSPQAFFASLNLDQKIAYAENESFTMRYFVPRTIMASMWGDSIQRSRADYEFGVQLLGIMSMHAGTTGSFAFGTRTTGGVRTDGLKTDADLYNAVKLQADIARVSSNRPGTMTGLLTMNKIFVGPSQPKENGQMPSNLTSGVTNTYTRLGAGKTPWNGCCGEANVLSMAQRAGYEVRGGSFLSLKVRGINSSNHGTGISGCASCRPVFYFYSGNDLYTHLR